MTSRSCLPFAPLLGVASIFTGACHDVSWPSGNEITTVRILGVRADPASVAPGQTTRLSALCADGRGGPQQDPTCAIEMAWFAGCNNPPQNDPSKCFAAYASWAPNFRSPLADTPVTSDHPEFQVASEFDFYAPSDVLAGTIDSSGMTLHYGVSYVFFMACAGRLYPVLGVTDRLPVECRDRDTDALLDQRAYVAGFTTIFSYDLIQNQNPELLEPQFDGGSKPAAPCGSDLDCPASMGCSSDAACVPLVPVCKSANSNPCQPHCLSYRVPNSSFALSDIQGNPIASPAKSLWWNYYTNAGAVPDDASLGLPGPVPTGRSDRYGCINWTAPNAPTDQARIWTVLRDNHGGLNWAVQRVLVR